MDRLPQPLQLKVSKLRQRYQSSDSGPEIDGIEQSFRELLQEKRDLSQPAFKKFVDGARKRVAEGNALLMNDESLLTEEGKRIAWDRNVWRAIVKAFDPEARAQELVALEELIDDKLA